MNKHCVNWSPDEDAFLENNYLSMSYRQIGEQLGRSEKSVGRRKAYLRLPNKQSTSQHTHCLSSHPIYRLWTTIKTRCENPNTCNYHRYGARGISVCEAWRNDFTVFYEWCMANGWEKGLQIDRINNDLGYCPENCRFCTNQANNQNRSNNKMNEDKVRLMKAMRKCGDITLRELGQMFGIDKSTASEICSGILWGNVE